jgi:hypothetical protein
VHKPNELLFIDRHNFTALQDKSFNLDDIITLLTLDNVTQSGSMSDQHLTSEKVNSKVSLMTQAYLSFLNDSIYKALFDQGFNSLYHSHKLSHQDIDYIKVKVKAQLFSVDTEDCYPCIAMSKEIGSGQQIDYNQNEKYYEIISTDSSKTNYTLVVIEEEFLSNLTECKEELSKFLLDCLSYQYKSEFDVYSVLKLYLSLKVNEGYFDLVKLRAQ